MFTSVIKLTLQLLLILSAKTLINFSKSNIIKSSEQAQSFRSNLIWAHYSNCHIKEYEGEKQLTKNKPGLNRPLLLGRFVFPF